MQYPSAWLQSGSYYVAGSDNLYMTYDAMSRMQKMGSTAGAGDFVSATGYNVDGTLATMTFGGGTETRSYNTLGQLTGIAGGPAGVNIGYSFPGTGNNGRASSMTFSGETVTYAYDALNRLVSASSSQAWAETYAHDRYGNLTNKGGQSIGVDQSSNRLTGGLYDANGNYFAQNGWEYDIENRLTKAVGGEFGGPILRVRCGEQADLEAACCGVLHHRTGVLLWRWRAAGDL